MKVPRKCHTNEAQPARGIARRIDVKQIQYNLNGSNPDGSFTVDDSKSFFSSYKILPIAQENKYLRILFSYFIMELYVVCTH